MPGRGDGVDVAVRELSTQVKGLTDPKVTIKGSSWMTQSARNAKFMTSLYPIVMRYLRVKKRVAKMRKQLKGVDREGYFQWEDRLIPQLSPEVVQERAVATGVPELAAWGAALGAAASGSAT